MEALLTEAFGAVCILSAAYGSAGGVAAGHASSSPEGVHPFTRGLQERHCTGVGQDLDHEQEGIIHACLHPERICITALSRV